MVGVSNYPLPSDHTERMRRVAARFRAARHAKGMTQDQTAAAAGVDRKTVQSLEADRVDGTGNFQTDILFAVAHVLDLDLADLFD